MEYKIFGRTGMKVSVIGCGGAVLGIPFYLAHEDTNDPTVQSVFILALERAVELGINYFDSAPGYGNGVGETTMGGALSKYRDKIYLASKVTDTGSPSEIRSSVEQSLRRMNTEYLDVIQFHGGYFNDKEADNILNGGPLETLEKLRNEGKVKFIGVTAEVPTGSLERMLTSKRFDVLQICYNLANQLSCDHSRQCRGICAIAEENNMGIVTMRTATSGFMQKLLKREFGLDEDAVTQMCIKYVLSTPEIDVALVGMRNPKEVEINVALANDVDNRYDLDELHNRFR